MNKKRLSHGIFWIVFCLVLAIFYSGYFGFRLSLYLSLVAVSFQATLTYANIGIYLPMLFRKKRIALYVLAIVLTILILTLIRFQLPSLLEENGRRVVGMRFRMFIFEINMLLTYSLSTAYYFILEWFRNQRIRSEQKLQQVQNELKYLKNQINPHFLFNTLNNIYTLCYLKDDHAAPAVLKLSDMMRYLLYESNTSQIELDKEIDFIRCYLDLQQLKRDELMGISFEVKGVKGHHRIAPLILISFFENCFKHGDIETNPQGWVHAQLSVDYNNEMELILENSKKQIAMPHEERKPVGLDNVRNRLSLLYKDRFQLEIKNEEATYRIYLKLTLNE
jgi:two-component system, LytTR family, sensor kinase